MCLFISEDSKKSGPFKAEEDIVVYKLVTTARTNTAWWNSNDRTQGSYYSPYRGQVYELGEKYSSTLNVQNRDYLIDTVEYWGLNHLIVGSGSEFAEITVVEQGLHTFVNYEEALAFLEYQLRVSSVTYQILKCVIPAGSECFLGKWVYTVDGSGSEAVDSYASSALKVIEEIV